MDLKERTTVRLPKALMKLARDKSRREGRTLTELIQEGLWIAVGTGRKADPGKPFPVSKTNGRCLVDTTSNVAMFDAMDAGLPFEKLR
jgi:hypothetical protein